VKLEFDTEVLVEGLLIPKVSPSKAIVERHDIYCKLNLRSSTKYVPNQKATGQVHIVYIQSDRERLMHNECSILARLNKIQ
jgi:hypothetical protein